MQNDNNRVSEQRYTENQTAQILGISAMTVRRRREAGELGYYQLGKRIYISASQIDQFLEKNKICARK